MELGSQEWKDKAAEHYKFPCKVAFVMIKEGDGSVGIFSTTIKSKAKLENVKFSDISKATWTSEASAVLAVKELNSADEYLEETLKINDSWGWVKRGPKQ
jgi:hypothetical protein